MLPVLGMGAQCSVVSKVSVCLCTVLVCVVADMSDGV